MARLVDHTLRAASGDKVDRDRLKAYRHALRKRGLGSVVLVVDRTLTGDVRRILAELPPDERADVIARYVAVCNERSITADDAAALMLRSVIAGVASSRMMARILGGKGSPADLKSAERLAASSRLDAMQSLALQAASVHVEDPIVAARAAAERAQEERTPAEPEEPPTPEEVALIAQFPNRFGKQNQ